MRNKFFQLLDREMDNNQRIVLLFADMGRGIYETFKHRYQERVLNIGIAEQNLIGMAAGMASMGMEPYCYTISNFITERCYEQIRNDICVPNKKVVLIGTSTGYDSGKEGISHYSIEDIGIMKSLPQMEIYSPGTLGAVEMSFERIIASAHPCYIRLTKNPFIDENFGEWSPFLQKSADKTILFITYGDTLAFCMNCAKQFDCVSVYEMNIISPVNTDILKVLLRDYHHVIIVEQQLEFCGLYNSICQEIISSHLEYYNIYHLPIKEYSTEIGDTDYFADRYGYSAERLAKFVRKLLSIARKDINNESSI